MALDKSRANPHYVRVSTKDRRRLRTPRTIAARRKMLRLSQEALARRANISIGYVRVLEAGESIPTIPVARRIAKVLQTTLDALWPAQEDQSEGAA